MRELTKSLLSFSWAMSLFGIRQASSLLSPGDAKNSGGPVAGSFQALTRATEEQLGSSFISLFRAGDNFQRGAVDLFFSLFRFDRLDPSRAAKLGKDLLQQTAGAAAQTAQAAAQAAAPGWGTPPVGTPP